MLDHAGCWRMNASLVGHSEGNEHHKEVRPPNEQADRVNLIATYSVGGPSQGQQRYPLERALVSSGLALWAAA